jgi:hypothetical protein
MPCYQNAEHTLHICAPSVTLAKKYRRVCPNCKTRRTFVGFFYDWYGWTVTCLGCGDQWQDGEWMERPFCPGWRKQRIQTARDKWARWQRLQVADALDKP